MGNIKTGAALGGRERNTHTGADDFSVNPFQSHIYTNTAAAVAPRAGVFNLMGCSSQKRNFDATNS